MSALCIESRYVAGASARSIRPCGAKYGSRKAHCVIPTMTSCSTCRGWRRVHGWRAGPARRSPALIHLRRARVSRRSFINISLKCRAVCTLSSAAGVSALQRSDMQSPVRHVSASRQALNRENQRQSAAGGVAGQRQPRNQAVARPSTGLQSSGGCQTKASPVFCFAGRRAERIRTESLAARMQRAEVRPPSALDAIASTLATASIVIGLDTGLTHLAAALGRPTVGIFCDYDPALVGLTGDADAGNSVISVGNAMAAPSASEVIDAAARVMNRPL